MRVSMRSRHAYRRLCRGLLSIAVALAACLPALGQDESSSHASQDCRGPLFGKEADELRAPVDFCRELVIVDPAVTSALDGLAFRKVVTAIFDSPDTDALVVAWTDTWNQAVNGGIRPHVAEALQNAWTGNKIKLIAITNRLDLAGNPDAPEGEARLVYQIVEGRKRSRDMTIIFEFAYPKQKPSGTDHENLRLWAQKWKALRNHTTQKQYVDALAGLVAGFNTCASLKKIRTNEKLETQDNAPWEFREFDPVCPKTIEEQASLRRSIAPSELAHTPDDSYRTGQHAETLARYLDLPPVRLALDKGRHDFRTRYTPGLSIGLGRTAHLKAEGKAWVRRDDANVSQARMQMAFNTCDGCHGDMQDPYDSVPQIWIPFGEDAPVLSSFLRNSIPLPQWLSGCGDDSPAPGCSDRSSTPYWNEQRNRIEVYRSLNQGGIENSIPAFPLSELQYRYH